MSVVFEMQIIVMLNLLIAIMGGSFEDISENAAPEILKQKAELLLAIVAEMPDDERDLSRFPVRTRFIPLFDDAFRCRIIFA